MKEGGASGQKSGIVRGNQVWRLIRDTDDRIHCGRRTGNGQSRANHRQSNLAFGDRLGEEPGEGMGPIGHPGGLPGSGSPLERFRRFANSSNRVSSAYLL